MREGKQSVTVVITTFKRPEKLARAIESCHALCIDGLINILVVDDDAEMSGFRSVVGYPSVQYFAKRGLKRGLSMSRNIGLSLVTSDYIIFLDDDDFFIEENLRKFLHYIDGTRTLYVANWIQISNAGNAVFDTSGVTFDQLLVLNRFPIGCYAIANKKNLYTFDVDLQSHEDWDFLLKNLNAEDLRCRVHLAEPLVVIDKTEESDDSMQIRRKRNFWSDFIGIYGRFPAPHLSEGRKKALEHFCEFEISENLLK